jgi:glutamate--cysteine ligase
MSLDLPGTDHQPVTSVDQLILELAADRKPPAGHRVGLEHEKLVYPLHGQARPVPYGGASGIGALLEALASRGGSAFRDSEDGPVIAVVRPDSTLSLEPGGQLELSGAPHPTAREAHAENLAHLVETREVARSLGLGLVTLGYRPFGQPVQMPWMPKVRYEVMRRTLGARGALAHDMMLMTCTGQVSLDWESEEDCARKVAIVARMTPALIALYANSPLVNGRPSGYLSYRSHVWTQVDPARCGVFPEMVDGRFSYRAYVDWALRAPLLFLRRQGRYLTPKLTFAQLLASGFEGKPATLQDWRDHLSTLFPEVRLKQVLEVRAADCVGAPLTGALVAFLRGLLYDVQAIEEAQLLLPPLSLEAHAAQMERARKQGLRDEELGATAQELVAIARAGLSRLDPQDVPLLEPLVAVAQEARSPAEAVLEVFERGEGERALLEAFAA